MSDIQRIHVSELQVMAEAICKSGLFGLKTQDQALAMMLLAQAEGLHPATAARDYHIIQGRPTLKTDAMMARFQAAGGKVEWRTYSDEEVTGVFSHPAGGSVQITWTIEQAKKAGLAGKDVWKQFPRAMLRARVISEGIRTVYPGVVVGVYTPEEAQDFDAVPPAVSVVPDFEPAPQRTAGPRTLTQQVGNPQPTAPRADLITRQQVGEISKAVKAGGIANEDKETVRDWLGWLLGVSGGVDVLTLTRDQADVLLAKLSSQKAIEAAWMAYCEAKVADGLPEAAGA